ncbi:hypothetical protein TNCV_3952631 [Trichonephila clavipes]|uniref:Uncharacterized protein n=1 Tax=Trichonephila clavipes TaxID=2585209 RepID=A0A8X6S8M9_TRICX|nr:hypothetical protein TNCV_3952631 [Trichonephila clavipes]
MAVAQSPQLGEVHLLWHNQRRPHEEQAGAEEDQFKGFESFLPLEPFKIHLKDTVVQLLWARNVYKNLTVLKFSQRANSLWLFVIKNCLNFVRQWLNAIRSDKVAKENEFSHTKFTFRDI